jgi:hypothetical protein
MGRSVTTRAWDTSTLLITPGATAHPFIQVPPHLELQHILSYRYQHTSGYKTSSHTGITIPRATACPLIQIPQYLGLQHVFSYRYRTHYTSGQCCGSGSASFWKPGSPSGSDSNKKPVPQLNQIQDTDLHQSEKLDPESDPDPAKMYGIPMSLFDLLFKGSSLYLQARIRIQIPIRTKRRMWIRIK